MKKDIHPKYYNDAKIICNCGNVIITGSTIKERHIEVCSKCHPFFTGEHRIVDMTGRVDKFNKKYEKFFSNKDKKK
ncbi:MAG TPA: 50S ribosomal protein L31 [Spirochaetota bacterium]|nr:50S ribosomal protein L31 [Spirochaetota bacterium]HOM38112.1 50S ribosomal protein L31 [Spirochaetota bacterium]HPQ48914.1 50S ribosomal protein L31 [Spirochaetota bacterium]